MSKDQDDEENNESYRRLRLLTLKEVRTLIPYTPQHIYRLERAGKFPRRRKLGDNRVAWRLTDIEAWIVSRQLAPLPLEEEAIE